jgi:peroxiredoxin
MPVNLRLIIGEKIMKKIALIIISTIAVIALSVAYFQQDVKAFTYQKLTDDMFVPAEQTDYHPGLQIGEQLPEIKVSYQGQELTNLDLFQGTKGTVLVASRSVDWCPFCMRQVIELEKHYQAFKDAGLGLLVITYDTPALQQTFIDQYAISIPLLSDIDTQTFKALNILHQDYQPGDSNYGIPYPGMYVLNEKQQVVGKLFVESYRSRVAADAALSYAKQRLNAEF